MSLGDDLAAYVPVAGAARELGVSDRRVLQLIAAGTLSAVRVTARAYLVTRESVERYKRVRRPAGRPRRRST